ncbi:MAG: phage terminase large subunit family protein [Phycisphaerales bacterium]|nr:phage terminase large subunit family protein [Phycisphaerales bacterium]
MLTLVSYWLPAELLAMRPAERLRPSAWAERHRVLTRMQSARSGPWRNAQAPYLAGLMDLCMRRDVEEVTIVKAAQVGVSEALRNVIGYYAHQEPDPILLVLPDEQSGRKIVAQRIVPLLRNTPCLREQFTAASRDIQLRHITLANGFTLRLGWSGSPASLASDPCRVVINDEVDKFQPWSGRESDPITLGYARTQTYEGRRLIVNVSTPTTADGLIWRRFESTPVRLYFHVPCPHCGAYQKLVFSNVKWKKFDQADPAREAAMIEKEKAAWYECAHCHAAIHEPQRAAMIQQGRWQAEDEDGVPVDDADLGSRVGVHIWAAYALWCPLFRIAAEFVRCKGDPISLMGFTNSWLGEPFRQQIVHAKVGVFESKSVECSAAPARIVPGWARCLIATADTQKDHFYYVIRAWGVGFRSQRVDHGMVMTFEELRQRALLSRFPWQDSNRLPAGVCMLGIDSGGTSSLSGSRTAEVYKFALSDPARIKPLKGDGHTRDLPIRTSRVTYRPPDQSAAPFDVFLSLVNCTYYKDRLAHAITAKMAAADPATAVVTGEHDMWSLNSENDSDYNRQMTSEHKVLVRKEGGRQVQMWMPVSSGAANHYWDCEYMQFAVADMARVDLMQPPRPESTQRQPPPHPWPQRQLPARPPIRRHYG